VRPAALVEGGISDRLKLARNAGTAKRKRWNLIESLSGWPTVHRRHRATPLMKEREQYLNHLLQIGWDARRV